MAATPSFIGAPRIGFGSITTGSSDARSGTGTNYVDVISAGSSGTRILEIVIKADADPADSTVTFLLNNGTTSVIFDEVDIGNPAAGSATGISYRVNVTYANLVLPSGWKLQAAVTVTPTVGTIKVIAFGGDL